MQTPYFEKFFLLENMYKWGKNLSHLPIAACGRSLQLPIPPCAPNVGKSRFFLYIRILIRILYAGTPMMPPRVLASGPNPCGSNKRFIGTAFFLSWTLTMLITICVRYASSGDRKQCLSNMVTFAR